MVKDFNDFGMGNPGFDAGKGRFQAVGSVGYPVGDQDDGDAKVGGPLDIGFRAIADGQDLGFFDFPPGNRACDLKRK